MILETGSIINLYLLLFRFGAIKKFLLLAGITQETAKETALKAAGVKEEDVIFKKTGTDFDDGREFRIQKSSSVSEKRLLGLKPSAQKLKKSLYFFTNYSRIINAVVRVVRKPHP